MKIISMMDRLNLASILSPSITFSGHLYDHHTGQFKTCRRCDLFAVLWDVSTGRSDPHGCCAAERRNDPPVGSGGSHAVFGDEEKGWFIFCHINGNE